MTCTQSLSTMFIRSEKDPPCLTNVVGSGACGTAASLLCDSVKMYICSLSNAGPVSRAYRPCHVYCQVITCNVTCSICTKSLELLELPAHQCSHLQWQPSWRPNHIPQSGIILFLLCHHQVTHKGLLSLYISACRPSELLSVCMPDTSFCIPLGLCATD